MVKIPVTLPNGSMIALSPGLHNELQRLVVEEFSPRFAQAAVMVYLGDIAEKRLVIATDILAELKIPEMNHDKLPDVVLFDNAKNWLYLIEAVASHGPVSAKRHVERGRAKPLLVAKVKRLKVDHAGSVVPLQTLAEEARVLEGRVAELVNAAYGMTPAEIALVWATAPPRMPAAAPRR